MSSEPSNQATTHSNKRPLIILGAIILCALGLYFILMGNGKDVAANQCDKSEHGLATLDQIRPFAKGDMAAFQVFDQPRSLPELNFKDSSGKEVSLANFKGKQVLLNLWATWCVPCREEMPALETLQVEKASDAFTVLPVNIDTQGIEKPKRFYKQTGLKALPLYTDKTTDVFIQLKKHSLAHGMPTTLLVSDEGCGLGVLHGPAHWSGKEALALIDAAVK